MQFFELGLLSFTLLSYSDHPISIGISATPTDVLLATAYAPEEAQGYHFSKEELLAFESSTNSNYLTHSETQTTAQLASEIKKRSVESAVTCFNRNSIRHHVIGFEGPYGLGIPYEEYRWLSARCVDAYRSRNFIVVCHVTRRDLQGVWHYDRDQEVPGKCGGWEVCIDVDEKVDGLGRVHENKINDVGCLSRSYFKLPREEDTDAMALELSRIRELFWCTPQNPIPPKSSSPSAHHGQGSTKNKMWMVQEEVTLAGGGDYHAARLHIRDVTFPQRKEVAERWSANVTHAEVSVFPELGVYSRMFEFCIDVAKATPELENKWIILHHSIMDITNKPGRGRVGHGK